MKKEQKITETIVIKFAQPLNDALAFDLLKRQAELAYENVSAELDQLNIAEAVNDPEKYKKAKKAVNSALLLILDILKEIPMDESEQLHAVELIKDSSVDLEPSLYKREDGLMEVY